MKQRITRYDQVGPAMLTPHPLNARLHPPAQQNALTALLDSVGWVKHLVVNERTGYLLNGHLRRETALAQGESLVPVAYVDLDEHEERLLLALFDSLGELALTDVGKLEQLLADAQADAPALQTLLDQMAAAAGIDLHLPEDTEADDLEAREDDPADVTAKVGELHFIIPRDLFDRWRDTLYRDVGFDEGEIVLEIRRRLGL